MKKLDMWIKDFVMDYRNKAWCTGEQILPEEAKQAARQGDQNYLQFGQTITAMSKQ